MPTWSYMKDTSERTVVYKAKPKSNTKASVQARNSSTKNSILIWFKMPKITKNRQKPSEFTYQSTGGAGNI